MGKNNDANKRTPSTTTEWEWVTIRRRRAAPGSTSPEGRPLRSLGARDPREPLTVTVRYRGGSECWVELRARGAVLRVPGAEAIFDVMRTLWQ
jgi:hypothetical protein